MVLLGLLLLAASVSAAVSIAVDNTEAATFDVFGRTVTDLSPGGLMLLGIALGVAGLAGLLMIRAGLRHKRRQRLETKHVVQETRSRVDELEEENARLREAAMRRESADGTSPQAFGTATGGTDTAAVRDRDDDARNDRDQDHDRHTTPTMATAPAAVDLRGTDRTAYPEDASYAPATADTPAFDETTQQHGGRVFGRRNR